MTRKRRYTYLFCLALAATGAQAQHVSPGPLHSADSPREDWILPGDTVYDAGKPKIYSGKPMRMPAKAEEGKSLAEAKPEWNPGLGRGQGTGWGLAQGLHKGLNLSVDLSAFATFGKHAPHRGGFAQTIDAAYLTPLTKDDKLWMALGMYVNNVNYGGDSFHDGGLYGILGYKIDEHWEAYVYGQLSVANNYGSLYGRCAGYGPYGYGAWGYGMWPGAWGMGVMPGGYGMGAPGANTLGAGIRYTNSKKTFSFGVNFEGNWYNQRSPAYYRQYDYPAPQ